MLSMFHVINHDDFEPILNQLTITLCIYSQVYNRMSCYLLCGFPVTVPEQPTNLQGESITPNSIQLSWDPPEDSGESIQSFELYYNDSHFRQNVRITIVPAKSSYLLQDLTPDTVYHIQVAAKSKRGEGAKTPTIQVRTQEYGKEHGARAMITREMSNRVVFQVP